MADALAKMPQSVQEIFMRLGQDLVQQYPQYDAFPFSVTFSGPGELGLVVERQGK